jgi:hypothetical protein
MAQQRLSKTMFELYEIWAQEEDGYEELIETTPSRTQAFEIAEATLGLGYFTVVVFQENELGDLEEIKRFEHS